MENGLHEEKLPNCSYHTIDIKGNFLHDNLFTPLANMDFVDWKGELQAYVMSRYSGMLPVYKRIGENVVVFFNNCKLGEGNTEMLAAMEALQQCQSGKITL